MIPRCGTIKQHLPIVHIQYGVAFCGVVAFWQPHINSTGMNPSGGKMFNTAQGSAGNTLRLKVLLERNDLERTLERNDITTQTRDDHKRTL
jgi:hypothetical protein